jgi:hypothetical protein
MVRLEDGDDVKVSVKQYDTSFTAKHKEELFRRMKQSIEPHKTDALYFTVRATIANEKDNWKTKSYDELIKIVERLFE